ncbi:MAG: GNAT family N-acetyltransferase [Butyrivibrio sp.]|nr:GNAT family N-acetyltransferase [Butyrivibrio sp.]
MELTSVGEKNLEYFLPFLGGEVRPEWGLIGAVEDDSAIGAVAFERRDNMAIMKYLFVDENYRRRGVASELLDAAKRAFFNAGIYNFLVYYDENEELTAFLSSEGFTCAQSDPVYSYPIDRALVSKKIGRLLDMGSSKNTLSYGVLPPKLQRNIHSFLEQKSISSTMLESGTFDEEFSFAYIKDDNIKGLLLAQEKDPDLYLNLLLTDKTDTLIVSCLLSALAKAVKEHALYDGQLIMVVTSDHLRNGLEKFFGEHLNIRTYSWSALLKV